MLFGPRTGSFLLVWTVVTLVVSTIVFLDSEPVRRPDYDRTARGFVAHVEKDNDESDRYLVTATFHDDGGHVHEVRSYLDDTRREGSLVDVRYEHAHPDHAVIAGGRTRASEWFMPLVILAFLGVGLAFAFRDTKPQRLALGLLPSGVLAQGTVVEHGKNAASKGRTWTTRFEFTTLDQSVASCEVETDRESPYAVGQTWPILFDPSWPDRATPLAHFDSAPTIGADDRITYRRNAFRVGVIGMTLSACAILAVVATRACFAWL
jgi:hypothetical protein